MKYEFKFKKKVMMAAKVLCENASTSIEYLQRYNCSQAVPG
jgi:hypothetical protein